MNAKEINSQMTSDKWIVQDNGIFTQGHSMPIFNFVDRAITPEDKANCEAAVLAIDNTFKINFDPTYVKEMRDILLEAAMVLGSIPGHEELSNRMRELYFRSKLKG